MPRFRASILVVDEWECDDEEYGLAAARRDAQDLADRIAESEMVAVEVAGVIEV